ncbi:patatin-like phospholipase family protein [Lysobacter niastensis]|nr:patatin-like phospholipase family protein [Lysobacter niastensis]
MIDANSCASASMSDTGTHRTAFVLAGGGSLGAVEVGMLQALLKAGEQPSFLVGTSAGAINAAYFADRPTGEGADGLEQVWCALRRSDVMPISLRSIVVGMFGRRDHLVDSHGLRRLLERHISYQQLENASLPIHIVASELATGQEVLLSSGPAVDAVLASSAIPGVFPPVHIGTHVLVDGAIANNAPISVAVALGATRVIVLPAGYSCALHEVPSGAIPRAMHAISLLIARQLVADAQRWLDSEIELRIVPSLCPVTTSSYDYSMAKELISRARESTEYWIEAGGLQTPRIPSQLVEHRH